MAPNHRCAHLARPNVAVVSILDDEARTAAGSNMVTKPFCLRKAVGTYADRIAHLAPEAWISVPDHRGYLIGEYGSISLLEPCKNC